MLDHSSAKICYKKQNIKEYLQQWGGNKDYGLEGQNHLHINFPRGICRCNTYGFCYNSQHW